MAVPDDDELEDWLGRPVTPVPARTCWRPPTEDSRGLAVLEQGEGPTVALRVDIDALPITEQTVWHTPQRRRSSVRTNEGYMHACGHDAHATIGLRRAGRGARE